jgi:tetratricopeptide (TPR) repeat protein
MNEFSASQGVDIQLKNARAMDDFNEALKRSPHNAYILYDRATFYAHRQDYNHAIDDFTKAIQQDPNLAEAYYNRGLCRLYAGNTAEGNKDLSKAGELGLFNAYSIMKKQQKTKK